MTSVHTRARRAGIAAFAGAGIAAFVGTTVCGDNGGYAEIRQNEVDRGIRPVGVDLVHIRQV